MIKIAFNHIASKCSSWVQRNPDKLQGAYLTQRDGRILFIAVSILMDYDEPLHDSLIDLDMDIANDPDARPIRLATLLLPPVSDESLKSFTSPEIWLYQIKQFAEKNIATAAAQ
jgi:hypothetical protein